MSCFAQDSWNLWLLWSLSITTHFTLTSVSIWTINYVLPLPTRSHMLFSSSFLAMLWDIATLDFFLFLQLSRIPSAIEALHKLPFLAGKLLHSSPLHQITYTPHSDPPWPGELSFSLSLSSMYDPLLLSTCHCGFHFVYIYLGGSLINVQLSLPFDWE